MRKLWRYIFVVLVICSCGKTRVEPEEPFFLNLKDRFIVLGDSVSYGTGSKRHHSWAAIIQDSLRFGSFRNLSVPGAVASSRSLDGKYDLASQISRIDVDDNFITVMIGINDCTRSITIGDISMELSIPTSDLDYKSSFSQGFIYDLRILREKCPKSLVVVIGPPDISKDPSNDLPSYINAEKQICEALDFPFIDISDAPYSSKDPLLCTDNIHPTDKGYKILADYILPRLIGILADNQ
ncbi:MAG: SGNH/GDSL hydrolase family protein [Bacteroidales bacterium]|nr:SGNH/GDSL hydrolase family protein [Bacteroidales bacterium]